MSQRPIKKSIAVPTLMLRELCRKKLNHGDSVPMVVLQLPTLEPPHWLAQRVKHSYLYLLNEQVVLAYGTESKKAFAILGEVSCILKTQNQLPKQLQNSKQSYCCCPSCCIFARINCQSSCKIANKVIVAAQAATFLPERDNNNNSSHIFESRKNTHVCRRQYYNNPPTTHSNGAFEMTITLGVFSKNEEHISGAELEQMFSIITGTTEHKCALIKNHARKWLNCNTGRSDKHSVWNLGDNHDCRTTVAKDCFTPSHTQMRYTGRFCNYKNDLISNDSRDLKREFISRPNDYRMNASIRSYLRLLSN
ncbi:hypothetical protein ACFE04_024334 [Oxalis oulophora]